MEQTEVTLIVDGREYRHWQSVAISCALTGYYRTFSVGFTREDAAGSPAIGIVPGSAVKVLIGGTPVLTGYVTASSVKYSAASVSCTVQGASRTVDLAESYIGDNDLQFMRRTVGDVLAAVAAPYGVGVDYRAPRNPQADIAISPTDPIQKLLDGVVKKHTLVLTDDAAGNLVVAAPGGGPAAADALELGKNILTGEQSADLSKIYSRYELHGQQTNAGSDKPAGMTNIKRVLDSGRLARRRVYVEKLSGSPATAALDRRLAMLDAYRWGQAHTLIYEVQGWRQTNGELWPINGLVHVSDSILGVEGDWLITDVTYTKDAGGSVTQLKLMPPEAFIMMGEATDQDIAEEKGAAAAGKTKGETASYGNYVKKGGTAEADWTKS